MSLTALSDYLLVLMAPLSVSPCLESILFVVMKDVNILA